MGVVVSEWLDMRMRERLEIVPGVIKFWGPRENGTPVPRGNAEGAGVFNGGSGGGGGGGL